MNMDVNVITVILMKVFVITIRRIIIDITAVYWREGGVCKECYEMFAYVAHSYN